MSWLFGKKKVRKDTRMEYLITDDVSFDVAESFRHLKATLSVSMPKKTNGEGVTVMMTSACPEDGKTNVAVNLGLMHALSDAKVLLLDADVRKGRVARYFKKRPYPGLSDCLSGQATLDEVTRKTEINDNFYYISCGTHQDGQAYSSSDILLLHVNEVCNNRNFHLRSSTKGVFPQKRYTFRQPLHEILQGRKICCRHC